MSSLWSSSNTLPTTAHLTELPNGIAEQLLTSNMKSNHFLPHLLISLPLPKRSKPLPTHPPVSYKKTNWHNCFPNLDISVPQHFQSWGIQWERCHRLQWKRMHTLNRHQKRHQEMNTEFSTNPGIRQPPNDIRYLEVVCRDKLFSGSGKIK